MDKKSNRTDLLAAGREKLRQYRQKKDNKGKDGKGKDGKTSGRSTNKVDISGKPDADVDKAYAIPRMKAESAKLPEEEVESHSSVPVTVETVVDSSIDSQKDLQSGEGSTTNSHGTNKLVPSSVDVGELVVPEVPFDPSGLDPDASLNHELDVSNGKGPVNVDVHERIVPIISSTVEILQDDLVTCSLDSTSGTLCDAEAVVEASLEAAVSLEGDKVMAIHEADKSISKGCYQSVEVDMATESKALLSVHDGVTETPAVPNNITSIIISEYAGDHGTVKPSVSVETARTVVETIKGSPQKLHRQWEGVMDGASNERSLDLKFMSNDSGCCESEGNKVSEGETGEYYGKQYPSDGPSTIAIESHQSLTEFRNLSGVSEQSACPGVLGNSVNLSRLAEVLKKLPDSDFRYLIKKREMVNRLNILPNDEEGDLPPVFQEQLYVANILKDFFNLLLVEQHELDQMPVSTSPPSDFEEKIKNLAAELSQCRSELEVAIREKEELQNLYNCAKLDAVEISAKVDELMIKFQESGGQVSCLSGELVSCTVLLEALQQENEKLLQGLSSVTEERDKFEEVMEQCILENRRVSKDLADSAAQLATLDMEISDLKMSLASANLDREKLGEEKEFLVHEKETLVGELTDCKSVLAALHQENAGLNVNLAIVTEEHDKLKKHEGFLSQEIERLSGELVASKDNMSIHQENAQLEADLKAAMARLEQLAEENIILQSTLEIHKAKLAEVDSQQNQLSSQAIGVGTGSWSQDSTTNIDGFSKISSKAESVVSSAGPSPDVCFGNDAPGHERLGLQDDASGVAALKGCLEEAEKMIQQLEYSVNGMHSQSETLSHSTNKASAPGVSKLIQAFESKASIDDHETDVTGIPVPSDPYSSATESISHLRTLLRSLAQNVEHVNALIIEEKDGCKAANAACGELEIEIEALKSINYNLEMRNIELEVLCGAMNQHAHDIEAKKIQLESLCEDLKRQGETLQSRNAELVRKFTNCYSRISGLQSQLTEIRKSLNEMTSAINDEVQKLQWEMSDDICAVDRQWKSTIGKLVPMIEKLNTVARSAVSFPYDRETSDGWDIFGHFTFSLSSACEVIEQLKVKLEAAEKDFELLSSLYKGANEKLLGLNEEHNSVVAALHKVSGDLINFLNASGQGIGDSEIQAEEYKMHDPLYYEGLLSKLGSLLTDMLQLKESHNKLHFDLLSRTCDLEELKKRCTDEDVLLKLVFNIKEVLKLKDTEIGLSETPSLVLLSSVSLLIQKYKEAEFKVNLLNNDLNSRMSEINELAAHVELLDSLNFQQQNEMLVLRESLMHAKYCLDNMQAELSSKVRELEQSEQRVASVREKLSIAVAKGKGLVAQRDSLKQSLADMSGELEKYLQELQLKDSRIHEVEEKLKAYSEAGERMEALESELSYIRNSATALRESFVLKDSTLQRIEEILEDLELPDHFHSNDIIEKVNWLAKSVADNSLLPAAGAASYSDVDVVVSDGCKDDVRPTSNTVDDFSRKFDELQAKYYELAEQNEMLEQSLMERNILVQRWEEILDRINTPPQIRSMEPEERIHWLGTALSEADNHMRSLQQKVENLENYCGSLSVDLEESKRKTSEHEASLQAVLWEKERILSEVEDKIKFLQQKTDSLESYCGPLSADLEVSWKRTSELESLLQEALLVKEIFSCNFVTLACDHETAISLLAQCEHEVDRLGKEIVMLQGKVAEELEKEGRISWIESEVRRLQGLILDVLEDSGTERGSSDVNDIQYLERLIGKLMSCNREVDSESHGLQEAMQEHALEHTAEMLMIAQMDKGLVPDYPFANASSTVCDVQEMADLRRQLAESVDEVARTRDERDAYMQKNQSLTSEFEVIEWKMNSLQDMLNQEEQKSASLREKLNLAVRRGKSVVQQRDSLKLSNEERGVEIEQLKSKIIDLEHALLDSRQKINDLTLLIEKYKAFETENVALKNKLLETEELAQQIENTLTMLLAKLGEIDTGGEIGLGPVHKLERIAKLCSDLHATGASFEQEAKKSKNAAELLLAELNEVQERNDALQEELAKACVEISSLSQERDVADVAKIEALSRLAKLSEEGRNQLAELKKLNSGVLEVKKGFLQINALANNVFSKDIELLNVVGTHIKSCLEGIGPDGVTAEDFAGLISASSGFKDLWSTNLSWQKTMHDQLSETVGFDSIRIIGEYLQQLAGDISSLKERMHSHSTSLSTEFEQFLSLISIVLRENASHRKSLESIKDEYIRLESTLKERDVDAILMRQSLSLLLEACNNSIGYIENGKAELRGDSMAAGDLRVEWPTFPSPDGEDYGGADLSSYENYAKNLADKLKLAVKDILEINSETVKGHTKELRSTVLNLQKELREKDIQRERMCMELVGQIKEAENTAVNYSRDLHSMENYAQDLERKLEMIVKERSLLEQKVEEFQKGHLSSIELGEKVKSLSDLVAAKEQEIEALMQALDEEENQMEALRSKVDHLEKLLQQKSTDLEHVEASRVKALKKLSVTVNKFDELHHMSEGLLSEIENLQSQLQDRDAEISFLRQEVTRCTNDALEATKMVKHRNSHDFHELLSWLDTMFSNILTRESHGCDGAENDDHNCKEHLQKDIMSIVSELQDLRVAARRKDALLLAERNRVEELLSRKDALEVSLQEKEHRLNSLQGAQDFGLGTSEIVEVEPLLNNWTAPVASTASQVRSLRKVNNDQVSIAVDADGERSGRFEDEDDDKVHGFKSLTTSRFVPKFTRPVSDMIDGLWVSCDRTLMRQPAFRLGIMIYWAVLHALLASFIV